FKLAEAMWGKQSKGTASEIASKACDVFNDLLIDRLEHNINTGFHCEVLNNIEYPQKFDETEKSIFNTKLLLSLEKSNQPFPGNIYEITGDRINRYPFNALIADSISVPFSANVFFQEKKDGASPSSQ